MLNQSARHWDTAVSAQAQVSRVPGAEWTNLMLSDLDEQGNRVHRADCLIGV
jgi:hypothetical protein